MSATYSVSIVTANKRQWFVCLFLTLHNSLFFNPFCIENAVISSSNGSNVKKMYLLTEQVSINYITSQDKHKTYNWHK